MHGTSKLYNVNKKQIVFD
ncbi:hypothetical protein Bhyg_03958 [Pseudolycoriella hygida]|uniref:Uncharacterized protein n=1 Tax=Pseudolycoriella hygida TaxID=35572 RepID=A0A9Q0S7Z4_9DIPT|nr:hypothetical protein Bhyg_03958 [Pseudolycoriella hygida]